MTTPKTSPAPTRSEGQRREPRAWQRMLSGRRLNLLDPSPMDVEIEDIAHGLSRLARWNGQTQGEWPFSVAQHSLLVDDIAARLKPKLATHWRLAVFLHDAPEYVVGDLISPFKAAVGLDYKDLESRIMTAVRVRFGLPGYLPRHVEDLTKRADQVAAYLEATQLAGFEPAVAGRFFKRPRNFETVAGDIVLEPWPPATAKSRFLQRFAELAPTAAHASG
jgi:hypothetical protein